jgi:hypothetical protein
MSVAYGRFAGESHRILRQDSLGLGIALYVRDVLGLYLTVDEPYPIPRLDPAIVVNEVVDTEVLVAVHRQWPTWWAAEVAAEGAVRHVRDEIVGRAWQGGTELGRLVLGYFEDALTWVAREQRERPQEVVDRIARGPGPRQAPDVALAEDVVRELEWETGRRPAPFVLGIAQLWLADPWFCQVGRDRVIVSDRMVRGRPHEYRERLRPIIAELF